jgi:hypothetical protein
LERIRQSGLEAYENSSILMPDDEDDYATPDSTVLPTAQRQVRVIPDVSSQECRL